MTKEQIDDILTNLESRPDFLDVARVFLDQIPEDSNLADSYILKKARDIFDAIIEEGTFRLFEILTGKDFEDVLRDMIDTNLCIQQVPDGFWKCFFCEEVPQGAYLLSKEGTYPAELYYSRSDIMGSKVVEREVLDSKSELLTAMRWHGKCGHRILSLWDYDHASSTDAGIFTIFANAEETIRAACACMAADFMEID